MKYEIIATGSSGNALLINESILIDCGVPYKKLQDYEFDVVFLTHIHSDHFNKATIKKIARYRPLVQFVAPDYLVTSLIDCGVKLPDISIIGPNEWYDIGIALIYTFELNHDVDNIGYKIHIGNDSIFYATDTNDLDNVSAKGYTYYFIEANYTEAEIMERIKDKKMYDEYIYENRVLNTHLSKEDADRWLENNANENSQCIYIHQHRKDKEL